MISVTIKLHSALTGKTTILGRMYIWNKGRESAKNNKAGRYNYGVAVCRKGQHNHSFRKAKMTRTGNVDNYPSEALNVWRLIVRALLSAFPEEVK
jgi:hypothetical protein